MSLSVAIAGIALAGLVFAFANYKSRQPYEPGKLFQVPYLGIQFAAVLAIVLLLGYLSSLLKP